MAPRIQAGAMTTATIITRARFLGTNFYGPNFYGPNFYGPNFYGTWVQEYSEHRLHFNRMNIGPRISIGPRMNTRINIGPRMNIRRDHGALRCADAHPAPTP